MVYKGKYHSDWWFKGVLLFEETLISSYQWEIDCCKMCCHPLTIRYLSYTLVAGPRNAREWPEVAQRQSSCPGCAGPAIRTSKICGTSSANRFFVAFKMSLKLWPTDLQTGVQPCKQSQPQEVMEEFPWTFPGRLHPATGLGHDNSTTTSAGRAWLGGFVKGLFLWLRTGETESLIYFLLFAKKMGLYEIGGFKILDKLCHALWLKVIDPTKNVFFFKH